MLKAIEGMASGRMRLRLALALVLIAVLGILGIGVEDQLRPTSLAVPGTNSDRGEELLRDRFGDSAPFAILLEGRRGDLDRQGPEVVRELRRVSGVSTLSPWDRGELGWLRPSPRKALILADLHLGSDAAVREGVPQVERALEGVRAPVQATQTGFATLSRALQDGSVQATDRAELVAVPVLLLVLLLVFRSPVAAAIPLAFGAAVVAATRGLLSLSAPHLAIDGFALTVATMMGLALGVDYALLMVSRFREELARGSEPSVAAGRTRRTAGRTTAFAGSTLVLAMAVILVVMPGTLFLSLAGTAIAVTLVSVLVAFFVAPPLLLLIGHNVNRWQLGRNGEGRWLMGAVGAALGRPRLAAALIGGVLVALALPALALETGPPSVSQLPADSAARKDAATIERSIGAGWDAPFVLVAATDHGPIMGSRLLTELDHTQRRIAGDPNVQTVIGPGQVARRAEPLREQGERLLAEEGEADPGRLQRLAGNLDRAAGGVGRLRSGVSEAAAGAGLLATGSGQAGVGAERISDGIEEAANGAGRALGALERIDDGSERLAEGQRRAALGARALRDELSGLMPVIQQGGLGPARRLRAQLTAAAAADPALAGAAREAELLVENLALARNQTQRARQAAGRLRDGQARLADGGAELHAGAARLNSEAAALPAGLERLGSGAAELGAGIAQIADGADALSHNLTAGANASQPLQRGLARAGIRVDASASRLAGQIGDLRRSSPRIFDSGYFLLSALDGAAPEQRRHAGEVIDLEHGGQAAQMLVIPRHTFNTPGSEALNERLGDEAARLAASSGMQTGVTGGPAQLADYTDAVTARVPLAIVAITLATFLVLVVVLRAIPLAALAVALNLLTVAVAFGVLTLLCDLPADWPLGGHDYVDAIGAAGIFGIVFGLSIDYAVFLLSRMRERHDAGASNDEAIEYGLRRTARVITGAASIMIAVFVAFAAAPIATVSQLGAGLTVAVMVDATVVRIVLLPALMLLIGERVWWLPRPLERLLPKVSLHGA